MWDIQIFSAIFLHFESLDRSALTSYEAIFLQNIYIKSKLYKVILGTISLMYMPSAISSCKTLGCQLSVHRETKNLMKFQ